MFFMAPRSGVEEDRFVELEAAFLAPARASERHTLEGRRELSWVLTIEHPFVTL